MVVGIEHTAIGTPDPQKLAQWYVETLGFRINYNSGRTVFARAPNWSMLEFITSEGALTSHTMKDPGIRHLAIAVSDFDAVYGQLKAKKVNFLNEATDANGVKTVFFTDLDGNILHIIQRQTPLP
jgi:glyoxylase I family protein